MKNLLLASSLLSWFFLLKLKTSLVRPAGLPWKLIENIIIFVIQTINHRKNNFLLKMKVIDPFLWNATSNSNRTVSFFAAIIFANQRGSCISDDKVLCQWAVNDNILWDFHERACNFWRQIGYRNKILLAYISVACEYWMWNFAYKFLLTFPLHCYGNLKQSL